MTNTTATVEPFKFTAADKDKLRDLIDNFFNVAPRVLPHLPDSEQRYNEARDYLIQTFEEFLSERTEDVVDVIDGAS